MLLLIQISAETWLIFKSKPGSNTEYDNCNVMKYHKLQLQLHNYGNIILQTKVLETFTFTKVKSEHLNHDAIDMRIHCKTSGGPAMRCTCFLW